MPTVPCPHPQRCGVSTHVVGSAAHTQCRVPRTPDTTAPPSLIPAQSLADRAAQLGVRGVHTAHPTTVQIGVDGDGPFTEWLTLTALDGDLHTAPRFQVTRLNGSGTPLPLDALDERTPTYMELATVTDDADGHPVALTVETADLPALMDHLLFTYPPDLDV